MTRQIAGRLQSALTTANYATTMRILQESRPVYRSDPDYNSTTRLDYNHGERDLISGRFTLAFEDIDLLGSTNVEAPSNGIIQKSQDYTAVGTWTHIFSDQLVNQLRVQFADDDYRQTSRSSESAQLVIAGLITYGHLGAVPFIIDQSATSSKTS